MATPLKSSLPQGPESAIDNDQTGPKPRLLDQVRDVIRCKHYSIRTTMIYTHVLNRGGKGVQSPGDTLFQD
jgi:hypothetical protein